MNTFRPSLYFLTLLSGMCFGASNSEELAGSKFERSIHPLFSIKRSLNENELIYEALTTKEGFEREDPIRVYWILRAEDNRQEPLTGMEKRLAYGVRIHRATIEEVVFSIKAVPGRLIRVHRGKKGVVATLTVEGEEASLREIFVQTRGGGPLPAVAFIEIRAQSLNDGREIVQRIEKKPRE